MSWLRAHRLRGARVRALTLIRPMAAAIVHGSKRIENRPRDLPRAMKGVPTIVAVHAGKGWDETYARIIEMIDGRIGGVHERRVPWYADHLKDEGIVGLMRLTGRVYTHRDGRAARRYYLDGVEWVLGDRWYSGPFGYEIDRVLAFPKPIECRGMQGWWPLPAHIEEMISASGAVDDLCREAE